MIKSNTTKQEIVKKLEASGEENQAGKKLFLLGDNKITKQYSNLPMMSFYSLTRWEHH